MGLLSLSIKIIMPIVVVIVGILYRDKLQSVYSSFTKVSVESKPRLKNVFSQAELSQYNGVQKKRLYLAVMGTIFDVTKAKNHYGKGGSYEYFVGKDGSRALITGNFKDESSNKDHILDLSCTDLFGLVQWKLTFDQKYKLVGVLIGRYFDEYGNPTKYAEQVEDKLEQCKVEKEQMERDDQKYPPCNMEWSADQGSRVWCTISSGGVIRSWVGVPRQMYTPGEERPRCVCVNLLKDNSLANFKEYDNCQPDSTSCIIES